MRTLGIATLWIVSLVVTWFASALTHSDAVGWNYVEDSFDLLKHERNAMREFVFERPKHDTDEEALIALAVAHDIDMFPKHGVWRNSTIGLVRLDDNGTLVDQCFSGLDTDGVSCIDPHPSEKLFEEAL